MRRWVILLIAAMLIPTIAFATSVFGSFADQSDAELSSLYISLTDEMRARGLAAYISSSGSKYHLKPTCSGMEAALTVTIDEAEAAGFEACKRCYKKPKKN